MTHLSDQVAPDPDVVVRDLIAELETNPRVAVEETVHPPEPAEAGMFDYVRELSGGSLPESYAPLCIDGFTGVMWKGVGDSGDYGDFSFGGLLNGATWEAAFEDHSGTLVYLDTGPRRSIDEPICYHGTGTYLQKEGEGPPSLWFHEGGFMRPMPDLSLDRYMTALRAARGINCWQYLYVSYPDDAPDHELGPVRSVVESFQRCFPDVPLSELATTPNSRRTLERARAQL